MEDITQPKLREIIDDFAEVIALKSSEGAKPTKGVINFRNEQRDGVERPIMYVPIDLLRFRKYNGRISSDVLSYEINCGLLNESTEESQKEIRNFLAKKDPEKTEELTRSIMQAGQQQPAIITCDGFLINGNRRKMVFDKLLDAHPGDDRYKRMKVIILPGKNEPGGPPSIIEIEELENRYQLQREGKAEYYGFDRALSIRRKMQLGMTLEQQLKDDPTYAALNDKRFQKEMDIVINDLLKPLECVDKYLEYLGRDGLYNTVATGLGDKEGRWQAFIDYSQHIYEKLNNEKKRMKLGIDEEEVGDIEDVAFKIIRMRELPTLPKSHQIMRDLPKWLNYQDSKEEFLKLVKIDSNLSKEEIIDDKGMDKDCREQDKIWQAKYRETFVRHIKKAKRYYDYKEEKETPVKLLESALKKLDHDDMDPLAIGVADLHKAMQLAEKIIKRASELNSEFYQLQKNANAFHK